MYDPNPNLTPEQLAALESAKAHWGRKWKQSLSSCWLVSRYPRELDECKHLLQQVRNQGGPVFLKDFRFPKAPKVLIEVAPLIHGGDVRVLEKAPERSPIEKLDQDINRLLRQTKTGKTLAEKVALERQIKALRQEKRDLILAQN